jgi:oxygen-independent coproporphyrinogen-3 oxidase
MLDEISLKSNPEVSIDTIYFGGGTPSLLTETEINQILQHIKKSFTICHNPEISLEANPEHVTLELARQWKIQEINRISVGIQSFNNSDLHYLGRMHSQKTAIEAIETLKKAGFENISCDFIIALPNQTSKHLEQNFILANDLNIGHISAYILEKIPDTSKNAAREIKAYEFCQSVLQQLGYIQYEISNFSINAKSQCQHNLKYWQNQEYIGFGISAAGYENTIDYGNTKNFYRYFKDLKNKLLPWHQQHIYQPELRRISVGLRLSHGLPESAFNQFHEPCQFLLNHKILQKKNQFISINPNKYLLLNEILSYFY